MKHLFTLLLTLSAVLASAEDVTLATLRDPELVDLYARLPVQEQGRIKPLESLARFKLQSFHGKQSIEIDNPEAAGSKVKLQPTEWLLVCWFRPDLAKSMPLFVVDNSDAIVELGLPPAGKRDRYSYNDLIPAREKLSEKRGEFASIEMKLRTGSQRMIVDLATNFLDFEMLVTHFDFVRQPFGDAAKSVPAEIGTFENNAPALMSALLPKILAHVKAHPEAGAPMQNPWLFNLLRSALGGIISGDPEKSLRVFPPAKDSTDVWHGPGEIMMKSLRGTEPTAEELKWLAKYEAIASAAPDLAKMKDAVKALSADVRAAADARGEAKRTDLEVRYNKADPFFMAPFYFLVGALILLLRWIVPGGKVAKIAVIVAWGLSLFACFTGVQGIVQRFLILDGLGPVSNLYETIIFIGTMGAIFCLFAELVTRKHFALLASCLLGCIVLFISIRFQSMEASDTMQTLQAVLITRFWLLTHVIIINLGYAACAISALLGIIYIALRLFKGIEAHDENARTLTKLSYGFVCAGLFLALVGTILGGVWANYSWGRFWGWDPKENGALMICLMCLIMLHARLGGFIRELGLHVCSLLLGMIVAFSWFGVNQLGVGLHAYGFTQGIWFWLSVFWGTQMLLMAAGGLIHLRDRKPVMAAAK